MKAPKSIAQAKRALIRMTAKVAKDRDELRELISDIEALADASTEAVESMEYAVDALSRFA